MTADDVDIIEKTTTFEGHFHIDRYRLRHRLFEGGWSDEMAREVFQRGHAVAVLLYDPARSAFVLIEQFRIGAFAALSSPWFDAAASPWMVECVAGIIGDGETPEEVARRETLEETGCRIEEIVPVCHYLVSPGGTSESVFFLCARVDASTAGGVHGVAEEHENIRVLVVPAAEAIGWLESGRVTNAMTLIALQWFRIHERDLRRRWGGGPAA